MAAYHDVTVLACPQLRDERCGIRVPMQGPEANIAGFAQVLRSLIREPHRLEGLSVGALARAEELNWNHKVEQIAAVCDRVLG